MSEDQFRESEQNLEVGLESAEGVENTVGVEQPLGADEIILGSDGQPINRELAWAIAHRYSAGNIDLIFKQAPAARIVQSYSAWTRAGYRLKSKEQGGVKPIYILKPKPYLKITRTNEEGEEETYYKAAFFEVVIVYDETSIDQTYKAVPEFFTPLQGNADMLVVRLTEILAGYGIKVEYRYVDYGAEGGSAGGVVYIRPDLPSINKCLTLVHETAHELLHKAADRLKLDKQTKECQAETVAYLVASHFGIQSPISADYLRMYGISTEVLKANMKITQEISHRLIEKMEEEYDLYAEFEYDPSQEQREQYKPRRHKGRSKRK